MSHSFYQSTFAFVLNPAHGISLSTEKMITLEPSGFLLESLLRGTGVSRGLTPSKLQTRSKEQVPTPRNSHSMRFPVTAILKSRQLRRNHFYVLFNF